MPLSGTGLPAADLEIKPGSLDFGVLTPPFAPMVRKVTVRNTAGNPVFLRTRVSTPLGGTSLSITGNTCGRSLRVGAACSFDVSPIRLSDGAITGRVEVISSRGSTEPLGSVPATGKVRGYVLWQTKSSLSALLRGFARRWHYAPRARLRRRGFPVCFVPNMDGRLTLTISHAPAEPSAAGTRLLARGRAPIIHGRDTTLRARPTRAGRLLLARSRRLRVKARFEFRTLDGRRIVTARYLRLPANTN